MPTPKQRDRYLRKTYGLTLAQYRAMLKLSPHGPGTCWITGRKPKPGKNLHVDHDHKTGRVRGLLCYFANHRLLGRGRENPELHERAAKYLRSVFDGRKL